MPDVRGKQGRKPAVVGTGFIHPYFALTFKHFRINRLQALRADA
jgi:hypothetical protein